MKDIYYKMKAWFVMKRIEKLEVDGTSFGPMQDRPEDSENDTSIDHNSFQ